MRPFRALLCAVVFLTAIPAQRLIAQTQQSPTSVPTLRITSNLVFLDVTVLDKKGNPVTEGLDKEDFTITEDKKPQRIFSFEAPDAHEMGAAAGNLSSAGNAPVTIFVLDLLNSDFEDFAYIRYSVHRYLDSQPALLASPAEMLVVGNQSLEMLQGYTRNKAELLYALNHLQAALPLKKMNGSFFWERFGESLDALQQIALQNKGLSGRKNIVWVGHGGPGVYLADSVLTEPAAQRLMEYVHATTNLLVDARMCLFVIYPGLKVTQFGDVSRSALEADIKLGDADPFAGDINFGVFVNETGGKLFYNRNDVDMEMKRSLQLGSEYYTLTYQPHEVAQDGKFRRIRVSVRGQGLRVVTKAGFFAPEKNQSADPRLQTMVSLAEAIRSTLPFSALNVKVTGIVRHPDTRTADLTVQLRSRNLDWVATDNGRSAANLYVAAASLTAEKNFLASKIEKLALGAKVPDPKKLPDQGLEVKITVRLPRKTKSVRVVVETEEGGRIGAADVDRSTIDAAPAIETPEPQLVPHTRETVRPAT
jgi:VWFA-related protein